MTKRRRIYLVNRKFQYKYIGTYIGIGLFAVLTAAVVMVHEVNGQVETYMQKARIDVSNTGEITLPIVLKLSVSFTVFMFIITLVLSFLHYMHARRIAEGVDKGVKRLKGGELGFGFRVTEGPDSDFVDMEAAFNGMLAVYRQKVDTLQYLADGMDKDLDGMKAAVSEDRDIGPRLQNLKTKLTEMDKALSGFKTSRVE